MEVTHIHWSAKPIIGGIERYLDSLIPELNNLGCNSNLICGNESRYPYQTSFSGLGNKRI